MDFFKRIIAKLWINIYGVDIYDSSVEIQGFPINQVTFKLNNEKDILFYIYKDIRVSTVYRFGKFFENTKNTYIINAVFDESLPTALTKHNKLKIATLFSNDLINEEMLFKVLVCVYLDFISKIYEDSKKE